MPPKISLHPEHGLNPTITKCFWCNEPKNEILLLGVKHKDRAPMYIIADYEPCEKCAAQWAQGITLIEATENDLHDVPPSKRPKAVQI